MLDDIAGAVGLRRDTLESVEHHCRMNVSERCDVCKDWFFQCTALQAELAASRKDSERLRDEIKDLLLTHQSNAANRYKQAPRHD